MEKEREKEGKGETKLKGGKKVEEIRGEKLLEGETRKELKREKERRERQTPSHIPDENSSVCGGCCDSVMVDRMPFDI